VRPLRNLTISLQENNTTTWIEGLKFCHGNLRSSLGYHFFIVSDYSGQIQKILA